MKRVEQGVPLETLDLSTCIATSRAVEQLSEIVIEVLGPKEALEEGPMILSCGCGAHGPFVMDDDSGVEDYYGYNTDSEFNNEGWDDEGWDEPDDGETDDDQEGEFP